MKTPNTITFQTTDNTWVMRITADRRIEVNENVEVTEAAQKVLDAMQHLLTSQQRTWVGLTYDERVSVLRGHENCSSRELCERIEAALKEKNA
jgi:predicted RNA binding protein with dsRBD fold (UPF0201 family)